MQSMLKRFNDKLLEKKYTGYELFGQALLPLGLVTGMYLVTAIGVILAIYGILNSRNT